MAHTRKKTENERNEMIGTLKEIMCYLDYAGEYKDEVFNKLKQYGFKKDPEFLRYNIKNLNRDLYKHQYNLEACFMASAIIITDDQGYIVTDLDGTSAIWPITPDLNENNLHDMQGRPLTFDRKTQQAAETNQRASDTNQLNHLPYSDDHLPYSDVPEPIAQFNYSNYQVPYSDVPQPKPIQTNYPNYQVPYQDVPEPIAQPNYQKTNYQENPDYEETYSYVQPLEQQHGQHDAYGYRPLQPNDDYANPDFDLAEQGYNPGYHPDYINRNYSPDSDLYHPDPGYINSEDVAYNRPMPIVAPISNYVPTRTQDPTSNYVTIRSQDPVSNHVPIRTKAAPVSHHVPKSAQPVTKTNCDQGNISKPSKKDYSNQLLRISYSAKSKEYIPHQISRKKMKKHLFRVNWVDQGVEKRYQRYYYLCSDGEFQMVKRGCFRSSSKRNVLEDRINYKELPDGRLVATKENNDLKKLIQLTTEEISEIPTIIYKIKNKNNVHTPNFSYVTSEEESSTEGRRNEDEVLIVKSSSQKKKRHATELDTHEDIDTNEDTNVLRIASKKQANQSTKQTNTSDSINNQNNWQKIPSNSYPTQSNPFVQPIALPNYQENPNDQETYSYVQPWNQQGQSGLNRYYINHDYSADPDLYPYPHVDRKEQRYNPNDINPGVIPAYNIPVIAPISNPFPIRTQNNTIPVAGYTSAPFIHQEKPSPNNQSVQRFGIFNHPMVQTPNQQMTHTPDQMQRQVNSEISNQSDNKINWEGLFKHFI